MPVFNYMYLAMHFGPVNFFKGLTAYGTTQLHKGLAEETPENLERYSLGSGPAIRVYCADWNLKRTAK